MSYHISKIVDLPLDEARQRAIDALAGAGFGVLTEIDVRATMKKKLDRDMPPYVILGACNPEMAWQAMRVEPKIGTMLPCNVIVREIAEGRCEVSAVDPQASMQAVENPQLADVAGQVGKRLEGVIEAL
jgi:uncharacterized protein (DUF302 family)